MARRVTSLLMTALAISIFLNLTFYMSLIQHIHVPADLSLENFTVEEGALDQTSAYSKYGDVVRDMAADKVDSLVKFGKTVHNSTVNKVGDLLKYNDWKWPEHFSTNKLYDLLLSSRLSRNTTYNKIYDVYSQFKAMVSPDGTNDTDADNKIREKFLEVMENFTMIEARDEELESVVDVSSSDDEYNYVIEGRDNIPTQLDQSIVDDVEFEQLADQDREGLDEDVGGFQQIENKDENDFSSSDAELQRVEKEDTVDDQSDDEEDAITLATRLMNQSDSYVAGKLQMNQVQFPAPLLPHTDFPLDVTRAWNATRVMYNCVDRCGGQTLLALIGILSFEHSFRSVLNRIKRYNLTEQRQEIAMRNIDNRIPPYVFNRHVHYLDFEQHGLHPHVYINIIREPLPRFLTWYYTVQPDEANEGNYRFHPHLEGKNRMTFDECVLTNHPACLEENAFQIIPYFCGQSPECRVPSRWALEKAKRRVVQDFVFVGVLEEFEQSLSILEIILPQFFESAVKVYKTMVMGLKKYEYYKKISAPLPSKLAVQEMSKRLVLEYEFFNFVRARMELLKKQILVTRR